MNEWERLILSKIFFSILLKILAFSFFIDSKNLTRGKSAFKNFSSLKFFA